MAFPLSVVKCKIAGALFFQERFQFRRKKIMNEKVRQIVRIAYAPAIVAGAFLVRLGLVHLAGEQLPPWITFYPAVMLTALLAGFRAGILATATAALVATVTYFPPDGFGISKFYTISLAIFVTMGILMSSVAGRYRRIRDRLEDLVRERTGALTKANDTLTRENEERTAAEEKLRASREDLRRRSEELEQLLDALPAYIWISNDAQCTHITGNKAANEMMSLFAGANVSQSAVATGEGVYIPQLKPDGSEYRPDELPMQRAIALARPVRDVEIDFRLGDGRRVQALGSAVPLFDASGNVRGSIAAFVDISGRKLAEELLARDLDAMIRLQRLATLYTRNGDMEQILGEIVETAIAISDADFGNIQLLDPAAGDLRIVAQRGFPDWWIEFWNSVAKGRGACGTALEKGERIIVEAVEESEIFVGTEALDIQRRAGVQAVQSTPLMSRPGEPLGMFSTHYKTPRRPDARELRLLDLLARQAADIIARNRAEDDLRTSEAQFRAVFDLSAVGKTHADPTTGRFLLVNDRLCEITGYSREELLQMTFQDITHPDDRARDIEEFERSKVPETAKWNSEKRYIRKDGSVVWVVVSGTVLFDAAGTPYRSAADITDITERKRAAQDLSASLGRLRTEMDERKKAEESVLRLNRLYLVLSETSQAIVRSVDRDYLFREFCRIAVEAGGFKLAWVGLVNQESGVFEIVAAEGATGYLEDIRITANIEPSGLGPTGIAVREGSCCTGPWHERGHAHGIRASASIALKQEGRVIGAFNLYADQKDFFDRQQVELLKQMGMNISFALDSMVGETVRREAEQALREQIAERERVEQQLRQSQKMESIGLLAGGVAHDFNNLLTGISGFGQILRDSLPADNQILQESVGQILTAAERAAALTGSLLAFSRKQVMDRRPMMIDTIIDHAGKFIRTVIGADIEFRTAHSGRELLVNADAGQIEQVLMNLAINSRDAMPHGGCLTISTREVRVGEGSEAMYDLSAPGRYALVTVTDTGAGIDRSSMEKIFEPFYTTKEVGKGTGLGLSIVYGIIKQHDGSILVKSEPGKGTTFDIYLPLIQGREVGEKAKKTVPAAVGTETLLIAEDEEVVRVFMQKLLERAGYKVIAAADGEEAVALFREHEDISLVLSDVVMPGKNGKEVLAEIRMIRPEIKVIFISGYTADIVTRKGILEEGVEFIIKPLLKNDLLQKIREVLDKN
jgi:PAS domain S-box-containing protein